jgi:MOSC domain-containing protein YiiM
MTWTGTVRYLHLTPRAFLPMREMPELHLAEGRGIEGDRYHLDREAGFYSHRPEDGRQITLFEIETLWALRRDHNIDLSPAEHRRNVTVEAVPLNHLVGRRFWLGETLLEATRLSTPCRHIEEITEKSI